MLQWDLSVFCEIWVLPLTACLDVMEVHQMKEVQKVWTQCNCPLMCCNRVSEAFRSSSPNGLKPGDKRGDNLNQWSWCGKTNISVSLQHLKEVDWVSQLLQELFWVSFTSKKLLVRVKAQPESSSLLIYSNLFLISEASVQSYILHNYSFELKMKEMRKKKHIWSPSTVSEGTEGEKEKRWSWSALQRRVWSS